MADVSWTPLPPQAAIDFFRSKGLAESFDWDDLWQAAHARAFTVAKSAGFDVLGDIRQALDRALAEGTTLDDFIKELRPKLQAKGWWGIQEVIDPATGETRLARLGTPRRLKLIFETNIRTANAAGRWRRFQETKARFPWLRYNHTPQEHPRPEHLAWDGTILPVDDPWWDTHFTPNGFNCKCWITQVSKAMLDAEGWEVTKAPVKFPPRPYVNRKTGEVSLVEGGIDPAFSYNPGKAGVEAMTPAWSPPPLAAPVSSGPRAGRWPWTPEPPRAGVTSTGAENARNAKVMGVFDGQAEADRVAAELVAGFPAELPVRAGWHGDFGPTTRLIAESYVDNTLMAEMSRTFIWAGRGKRRQLQVKHGMFWVHERLRGQGAARRMMRAALPLYDRLGVARIEVHAALENGGYTWARLGFRAADPKAVREFAAQLIEARDFSEAQQVYLRTVLREAKDETLLYELATARFHGEKLGERLLAKSDWYGYMDLTDEGQVQLVGRAVSRADD